MPSNMGRFQRKDTRRRDRALTVRGPVNDPDIRRAERAQGDTGGSSAPTGVPSEELWVYTPPSSVSSATLSPDGSIIFIGDSLDDAVHSVSTSDASQQWVVSPFSEEVEGVAHDPIRDVVYAGGSDGPVFALDTSDGSELWSHTPTNAVFGLTVAPSGSWVYSAGGYLTLMDASDGSPFWEKLFDHSVGFVRVSPDGGTVYAILDFNPEVIALDASATGATERWAYQLPTSSGDDDPAGLALAPDGSAIYLTIVDTLYAVSSDGALLWESAHPDFVTGPVVPPNGLIYTGCNDGRIRVFNTDGESVGDYNHHATISPLCISSDGAHLYAAVGADVYKFGIDDPPDQPSASESHTHDNRYSLTTHTHTTTINGLDDVSAGSPSDGDRLEWDNDAGAWAPAAPPSGGSSSGEAGVAAIADGSSTETVSHSLSVGSGQTVGVVATPHANESVWCSSRSGSDFTLERAGSSGQLKIDYLLRVVDALSGTSYMDEVLADSPVAYWRLEETSGSTVSDETGNGHQGSVQSGVTLDVTGQIGSAADLDGTDTAYINVPHDTAFQFGSGDFTLECWGFIRSDDSSGVSQGQSFITKYPVGDSVTPYYGLTYGGGEISFACRDSSNNTNRDTVVSVYSFDTWYHIVGVREGDTFRLYIDGVLQVEDTDTSIDSLDNTADVNMGYWWTSGNALDGIVDEVAIYGTALSQTRIQAHYGAA